MKVKVIKKFYDRVNTKYQEAKSTLDVEEKRGKELITAGVAEAVKAEDSKTTKKATEQ